MFCKLSFFVSSFTSCFAFETFFYDLKNQLNNFFYLIHTYTLFKNLLSSPYLSSYKRTLFSMKMFFWKVKILLICWSSSLGACNAFWSETGLLNKSFLLMPSPSLFKCLAISTFHENVTHAIVNPWFMNKPFMLKINK